MDVDGLGLGESDSLTLCLPELGVSRRDFRVGVLVVVCCRRELSCMRRAGSGETGGVVRVVRAWGDDPRALDLRRNRTKAQVKPTPRKKYNGAC